jgi:hypothetical protein
MKTYNLNEPTPKPIIQPEISRPKPLIKKKNNGNPLHKFIKTNVTPNTPHNKSYDEWRRNKLLYNNRFYKCRKLTSVNAEASVTSVCWYDGEPFNNDAISIPERYDGKDFHNYGHFCSFSCAKTYLREEKLDHNSLDQRMQLLEYLYSINTGNLEPIKESPNKLTLKKYGGLLSITEFRNSNCIYNLDKSPIIPISYHLESVSSLK